MAKEAFETSNGNSPFVDLGAQLHADFKRVLVHMRGGDIKQATGFSTGRLGTIRDSGQARPSEIETIAAFLSTEPVTKLLTRLSKEAAHIAERNRDTAAAFGLGLGASV